MQEENWKGTTGLDNFVISNLGRLKSLSRYVHDSLKGTARKRFVSGRVRKPSLSVDGYLRCRLRNNEGILKGYSIHRLVAETFIPNPDNLPEINHKNGIKTDNRVENLEWCTHGDNMRHAEKVGLFKKRARGAKNGFAKLTELQVRVMKEAFVAGHTTRGIANYFKLSFQTVWAIKQGKAWKHVTI